MQTDMRCIDAPKKLIQNLSLLPDKITMISSLRKGNGIWMKHLQGANLGLGIVYHNEGYSSSKKAYNRLLDELYIKDIDQYMIKLSVQIAEDEQHKSNKKVVMEWQ